MRTWTRLGSAKLCGACNAVIQEGTPLQVLTLPTVTRPLLRCQACAVGPCPSDLPQPAVVQPADLQGRMATLASVAVQFKRPTPPKLVAVPKKQAYRGEAPPVQPDMLNDLPMRTRR